MTGATANRASTPPLGVGAPHARRAPSPEELAVRAQEGSVEAFSALVELFQDRLYNFLLRRAGPPEAEDLAQETFIRAWQRIGLYRPKWRFSTWLFTIATRLAAGRARRASSGPSLSLETCAEPALREHAEGPSEDARRIWALVDEVLKPEQRTAVWLRYAEDLSMQEISRVMGKSEVGIRVMLHRARAVLAERWEAEHPQSQPAPALAARALAAGAAK
jgi:RNA polymerase sigma-70 factor (ECF subfamily)